MEINYMVTQSNELIEARQKKPLSAREQKIILTMVSMIQPTDEDFALYDISIREFHEMLGLEGREHYTEIKEIVDNLMSKIIEIPEANGGWFKTHWVSTARYLPGEGTIRLKFDPELKPYMLQLKTQFTSYRLSNVLSLRSGYSIRLYELMKRFQHLGRWECPVESLREKIGATTKTYDLYGNLKSKIILPSLKEINEKTDLHIVIKEIKKGRKVDKIEFSIQHFKEKEIKISKMGIEKVPTNSANEFREKLNKLAQNYSFDKVYFADIYSIASNIWGDQAEIELEMLVKYTNNESTINSPNGFIKSKLKTALKLHAEGEKISFSELELTGGRKEMIPEWFGKKDDLKEEVKDPNIEEERRKLLEELNTITKNS